MCAELRLFGERAEVSFAHLLSRVITPHVHFGLVPPKPSHICIVFAIYSFQLVFPRLIDENSCQTKALEANKRRCRREWFSINGKLCLCEKHIALRFSIHNIASLGLVVIVVRAIVCFNATLKVIFPIHLAAPSRAFFFIYFAVFLLLRYLKSSLFICQLKRSQVPNNDRIEMPGISFYFQILVQ